MKLFKRNKNAFSTDSLRTKVVYNTRTNFMVLVSYGSDHFQSIIEFINGLNDLPGNHKIKCVMENTAILEEPTKEESSSIKIRPLITAHSYYFLLLSGKPEAYAELFDDLDISNRVLEEIQKDIYNYCDSAKFQKLIDMDVLELSKFRYKNIVPMYDDYIVFDRYKYDDVEKICIDLPECFNRISLLKLLNIYYTDGSVIFNSLRVIKATLDDLKENTNEHLHIMFDDNCKKGGFYTHIMDNPTIEVLSIAAEPIYLKPDFYDDYGEIFNNTGTVPVEELDEIFQQDYDRFVNPTANAVEYESIDETIPNDAETENMRKEDVI